MNSAPSLIVHSGGCHCRRVRFQVQAPAELDVLDCNCSVCRMTGFLHLIVPGSRFELLSGREDLTEYTFNTGTARHLFCRHCGIKSFYVPRSHPDGFDVNARCLDAGTVTALHVTPFDDNDREAQTAAIAHLTDDASTAPASGTHRSTLGGSSPPEPGQAAAMDTPRLRVTDFDPRWRGDFARLNIEWLERWFTVEPIDREVLGDPESHILAQGGRVLFAVLDDGVAPARAVGTVALKHEGQGVYELTKMAVEEGHRGAGIGRALMEGALRAYGEMDGRELFLESSLKLAPALALYESVGFRHHPAPRPGSHYARADVYMVWEPDGDA
ncbi:GNAT family N-acetyltransferase [Agrilutibacter solisilvae]|uniref:GNAT family N-acetyltransferase n=1 Tax=Agrilutibacter solisilvae TaxID=2763317 RepID=A0A974Y314_9GAMM|nr:GNAT family N-acetyltransferase [Lysobacter solisilvae]QSX79545.1 GNAT family N-acetyltransferase [Lysobacter solisilvae]